MVWGDDGIPFVGFCDILVILGPPNDWLVRLTPQRLVQSYYSKHLTRTCDEKRGKNFSKNG